MCGPGRDRESKVAWVTVMIVNSKRERTRSKHSSERQSCTECTTPFNLSHCFLNTENTVFYEAEHPPLEGERPIYIAPQDSDATKLRSARRRNLHAFFPSFLVHEPASSETKKTFTEISSEQSFHIRTYFPRNTTLKKMRRESREIN